MYNIIVNVVQATWARGGPAAGVPPPARRTAPTVSEQRV